MTNKRAYSIGYKSNGVYQSINVIAESAEQAKQYFKEHKPDAIVYGATAISEKQLDADGNKGKPLLIAE